jgi:hypothetical protein
MNTFGKESSRENRTLLLFYIFNVNFKIKIFALQWKYHTFLENNFKN